MNKMSRKAFLKLAAAATALAVSPQLAFAQGASNWEAEWKKVAEAAKKEGELNLAISFGLGGLPKKTLEEFEKRFGVKVNMQQFASGSLIVPKILQEQQGNIFNYDIIMTSGPFGPAMRDGKALAPIRPQIFRPDVLDPKVWANGLEASFRDKEKQYGFAPVWEEISHIWINTNLIKPSEVKAVKDLLNPKLKGKMMFAVPTSGATVAPAMAVRLAYGEDMMKKVFVDQEPAYSRDTRQTLEQVIKGQRMIGIGVMETVMGEFKDQGLMNHVQRVVLEDAQITSTGNDLWIPRTVPHPNAAKLWINWLLTREGQTIYAQDTQNNSRRLDVPAGAPFKAPSTSKKYVHMLGNELTDVEYIKTTEILVKMVGAAAK
jgi:ABC-type Fe3+ transport system substrate-binding protein